SWIREHEPDDRGWYAGPVGWFDRRGDGEFAVALRSGVIDGAHAHLYFGAGNVAQSNAPSEYSETALKLRTLLLALGVTELRQRTCSASGHAYSSRRSWPVKFATSSSALDL